MKESGKLIELLNEYERKINPYSPGNFSNYKGNLVREKQSGYYDNGVSDSYMEEVEYSDSIIISKQYGFIKWLVENDKIEGETIGNYQSRTKLRTLTHTAGLWHDAEGKSELEYIKETFTDGLLMLLSISDTPIDLLCSLLK